MLSKFLRAKPARGLSYFTKPVRKLRYGEDLYEETIYDKSDFPKSKIDTVLNGKNITVLG